MDFKSKDLIYSSKYLSKLLSTSIPEHFSKLDRLKVIYRPFITPFSEVLYALPHGVNIFEIGFGNGALLNLVLQTRSPDKVGGVEISAKLVNNAKDMIRPLFKTDIDYLQKVSLQKYDGINLPDLSDYNYILLIDVIHHIPKKLISDLLIQLKQKMNPGATLILKDIDAGKKTLVIFNKFHDMIVSREIGNELSRKEAEYELRKAGFAIQSSQYKRMLWYPHFTILATS